MVEVHRNPPVDPRLRGVLVDLWVEVSNAGGAVGFVPPVRADDVRPVADVAFERVAAGLDDLVVAEDEGTAVGLAFLMTEDRALRRHWATVTRLQRHPAWRGRGVGDALLAELEAAGRDRGLERLVLTVRGGTGTEAFYLSRGFRLDGRLPGRIRVGDGDDRDELVLSKVLPPAMGSAPEPARLSLPVRRLDPGLPLPAYAHPGDAGLDLRARREVTLGPGERTLVPTGVAVAVPDGHVGLVHPRSGLAARRGLGIVNAPGTIDAGYRGEVQVVVVNHDLRDPVTLRRGDRIAQLVVQPVADVAVTEVPELPSSPRGEGGFGSTGDV